jgi:hypothetical protein
MYDKDPSPQEAQAPTGNPGVAFVSHDGKASLLPAVIYAGISVAMMRTGFLSLFFLVPLGISSVAYGSATAWMGFAYAVIGNAILSAVFVGGGLTNAAMDILYFTLLSLGFTWIMAGNPLENRLAIPHVRTVFRFTAAAVAVTLTFFGVVYVLDRDGVFSAITRSQIEAIVSGFVASSGADAAQQTVMERTLTTDRVIGVLTTFALRGGVLISAFLLFFFSRQMALVLTRLFRRQSQVNSSGDLIGFYVPRRAIWVLSLCLPVILAGRVLSLGFIEIAAWNLLVICALMFLAQGGGIVLFTLARRSIPVVMRLVFTVLFVFLMFSPGINALVLGGLVLLGIAEIWLPLRTIRKDPTA